MHPYAPPAPERMNRMNLDDDKTGEELSKDEVAIVFSFLPHRDIMRARVCSTWRDAAKKTLVPMTGFWIENVRSYNAMRAMSTALPNLQHIKTYGLGEGNKYTDGEDPDEEAVAEAADAAAHDINIISNFRKLRELHIWGAPLNGRYPVLFNFPLLECLSICNCDNLVLELGMLEGSPLLKELFFVKNPRITGNLSSLRVLKDALEKVCINRCPKISGDFMDLADFPYLKDLNLGGTVAKGDIRNIRRNDFPALENLYLPATVHGGMRYRFRRVSDVPSFMHAIHLLMQRTSKLFKVTALHWGLSEAYDNWYWDGDLGFPPPPFNLRFVQAGSRLGWCWCSYGPENERHWCEINWLNPEPSSDSSGYQTYIEELQRVQRNVNFYRGYHEIPTEDEYYRLREELP